MNFRYERFIESGKIDAEINHPEFGWIPCTFSPDDPPTAALFHAASATAKPYVEPEE